MREVLRVRAAYTGHLHKIRGRARYSASQNGCFHEHHRTQPGVIIFKA
jgi:hypothetical protein